jgi:plastocyanin
MTRSISLSLNPGATGAVLLTAEATIPSPCLLATGDTVRFNEEGSAGHDVRIVSVLVGRMEQLATPPIGPPLWWFSFGWEQQFGGFDAVRTGEAMRVQLMNVGVLPHAFTVELLTVDEFIARGAASRRVRRRG